MDEQHDYDVCPFCGVSLTGEPIPQELYEYYSPKSTHYSRLVGIEDPKVYDGVLWYECPDCHTRWNRWTGKQIRIAEKEV